MKLRRTVPDSVRAIEDRRLAWALAEDGTALVASPTCLHIGAVSLPWTSVEKVGWADPTLRVTEIAEVEGRGHSLVIDHGWRDVAQLSLEFVQRFVQP